MPSDRKLPAFAVLFLLALQVGGCSQRNDPPQVAPSRFAAVVEERSESARRAFCETTFPKSGPEARAFVVPKERAAPPHEAKAAARGGWRWVNLWATWCRPCVEEIPLLERWRTALTKDDVAISFEMWSIDDDEEALTSWLGKHPMPGVVRWLESPGDLGPVLTSFGLEASSPIPVHVVVDPEGQVRCARVGSVHEEDYGAVKAMLTAP